jgi:hypothetical protein
MMPPRIACELSHSGAGVVVVATMLAGAGVVVAGAGVVTTSATGGTASAAYRENDMVSAST